LSSNVTGRNIYLFVPYAVLLLLNHTLAVLGPVPHKDSVDTRLVRQKTH